MTESGFPEGRPVEADEGKVYLDRDVFQDPFYEFLKSLGIESYGGARWDANAFPTADDPTVTVRTDVFCVRPYSDADEALDEDLPNFEHFPTGLKVWWYKYALRSGQANRTLDLAELTAIFEACRASLGDGFDGGAPKPDRIGTIRDVRIKGLVRFLDLADDTGAVETFYVAGRARMSELLQKGRKVGLVTAPGSPCTMVVELLAVPDNLS